MVKGITELKQKGVYAASLIKKRRYWPRYIRGDDIRQHFDGKNVGDADAWPGTLDGQSFSVHSMKEPDYVMSLMTTYGTLSRDNCRETSRDCAGQKVRFKYPEVINNHFKYRHAVDDHNQKRHQPISLEVTWGTKSWPNRVFAFLLAITEVNVMLGAVKVNKIYETQPPMLDFRKKLAKELIDNPYLAREVVNQERRNVRRRTGACELLSIPRGKKFEGARLVAAGSAYPQRSCIYCHGKTRTYCRCSPGNIVCKNCFPAHIVEVQNNCSSSD